MIDEPCYPLHTQTRNRICIILLCCYAIVAGKLICRVVNNTPLPYSYMGSDNAVDAIHSAFVMRFSQVVLNSCSCRALFYSVQTEVSFEIVFMSELYLYRLVYPNGESTFSLHKTLPICFRKLVLTQGLMYDQQSHLCEQLEIV